MSAIINTHLSEELERSLDGIDLPTLKKNKKMSPGPKEFIREKKNKIRKNILATCLNTSIDSWKGATREFKIYRFYRQF